MEIVSTTFGELPASALGIVMRGCDLTTQEHRDGFVNGITNFLIEKKVLPEGTTPEQAWSEAYTTTTPVQTAELGGRTDLILVCKEGTNFEMGRFAMAKLQLPDTSWIEDFMVNDARDYLDSPRGPHAKAFYQRGEDNDE